MKKTIKYILPIIILILIGGLGLLSYLSNRIPVNPEDASGNTVGNLQNGGLFCEINQKIYFANPYDHNRLYVMNSDCSNPKRLSKDTISYLNAYGKFLFYVKNNSETSDQVTSIFRSEIYGIVRATLNFSKKDTIVAGYCSDLVLSGNTLLFDANDNSKVVMKTVNLKGSQETILSEVNFSNANTLNQTLYYSNTVDNHNLYSMSIDSGSKSLYMEGNTYMPSIVNNILYYIDLDNSYALTKVDLSNNEKTVISKDHCIFYNVYQDVIFYQMEGNQATDTHGIYRIQLDGSNPTQIAQGDYTSVHCTSQYTFIQKIDETSVYRVPTSGSGSIELFQPN